MTDELAPCVVLLIGLPGSGKSTYARQHQLPTLSSDAIRLLLSDDESNQLIHGRVFRTLRYLLWQRLSLRRPVTCVDATNLTVEERRPYVSMARRQNAVVDAVYFDIPLALCQARNAARSRVVPVEAMLLLASKLAPPQTQEGFRHIQIVSDRE